MRGEERTIIYNNERSMVSIAQYLIVHREFEAYDHIHVVSNDLALSVVR